MSKQEYGEFTGLRCCSIVLHGSGFKADRQTMRCTLKKRVVGTLVLILALALSLTARAATVNLQPVSGSGSNNRWMDNADNLYSSAYQNFFAYSQPSVSISYSDTSGSFSGTLTATGLKPNFAYQVKLVGNAAVDVWSNEQLGYAGRWWRVQPNPGNSNDADYDNHKEDPGYIYQGYLLFDFFTTDEQGNATLHFSVNSSYHVLWATHDSTGFGTGHKNPGANDSAVIYNDFTASPAVNSAAYSSDYGDARVGIFAEWESGRALPGQLFLPAGAYSCQLVVTEESFHQGGLGGGWASVLAGDASFTVIPDGDVNLDGVVSAADILLGMQVVTGNRTLNPGQFGHGIVAPLVSGLPAPDGEFNLADVLLITRKALGIVSF